MGVGYFSTSYLKRFFLLHWHSYVQKLNKLKQRVHTSGREKDTTRCSVTENTSVCVLCAYLLAGKEISRQKFTKQTNNCRVGLIFCLCILLQLHLVAWWRYYNTSHWLRKATLYIYFSTIWKNSRNRVLIKYIHLIQFNISSPVHFKGECWAYSVTHGFIFILSPPRIQVVMWLYHGVS